MYVICKFQTFFVNYYFYVLSYFQSNKINELNERISDTRKRVTEVKSSIDDMRTERDTKLSEMNNVKAKIKVCMYYIFKRIECN